MAKEQAKNETNAGESVPGAGGMVVALTPAQQAALASTTAPSVRGMLDQLKETQAIENGEHVGAVQSHTFGAWCRAKGINAQELSRLVRDEGVKPPAGDGDGPIMTEPDFDRTVKFKHKTAFGGVEAVKVSGYADPAAQRAAEADAQDAARKV